MTANGVFAGSWSFQDKCVPRLEPGNEVRKIARRAEHAHSARSASPAASSSLRFALSTFGYCRSSDAMASTIAAATITLVYHLLSAGTTYQGDSSVAVSRMTSSYAFV